MKKEIEISGHPFYYEAEDLSLDTVPVIGREDAMAILFKAKELLEEKSITFGLIYGTLLGAVREHDFIAHDYDVDVYVRDEDKLLAAIPYFYDKGLKLCRVTEGRLYSFRFGDAYIDFYILRKAPFPFSLYCYFVGSEIMPKKYFNKTMKLDFLGKSFIVPVNYEDFMKLCYGKTWRTPIKGFHGRYSVYPVYLYRKLKKWFDTHL